MNISKKYYIHQINNLLRYQVFDKRAKKYEPKKLYKNVHIILKLIVKTLNLTKNIKHF